MKTGSTTAGASFRTPAKHCLMCKQYGTEIGAAHSIPEITDLSWQDVSAGDGVAANGGEWAKNCSPGIHAYYARYPEYRGGKLTGRLLVSKPVRVDLYEKAENTYRLLLGNLTRELPLLGYLRIDEAEWTYGPVRLRAHNRDGREADLSGITAHTAVQVSNDPNSIRDWAMDPAMPTKIRDLTKWFLGMCTMGCNVGGLKRLLAEHPEEAEKWYASVESVVAGLPRWHDLYLCAIERDASQWAYLITAPRLYHNPSRTDWRIKTERGATSCFKQHGMGLRGAWWRTDPDEFRAILNYLFTVKGAV